MSKYVTHYTSTRTDTLSVRVFDRVSVAECCGMEGITASMEFFRTILDVQGHMSAAYSFEEEGGEEWIHDLVPARLFERTLERWNAERRLTGVLCNHNQTL